MAVLALGLVGAGIGGALTGGAMAAMSLGWSLGSMVGSVIDGPSVPDSPVVNQEGPRLGDLTLQTSSYGKPIPEMWGTVRLAGNMIWSSGIEEHRVDSSATVGGGGGGKKGGKRGGGGETQYNTTTYYYTCSFALALCAGPIEAVTRLWADGKLIHDARPDNSGQSSRPHTSFVLYKGTEDQQPDPTIQAHKGAANTPAFRGIAYVVFKGLDLTPFGSRVPNITAEVTRKATIARPAVKVTATGYMVDSYAVSSGGQAMYYIASDGDLVKVDLLGERMLARANVGELWGLATGAGRVFISDKTRNNDGVIREIDPATMVVLQTSPLVPVITNIAISPLAVYAKTFFYHGIYVWPNGDMEDGAAITDPPIHLLSYGPDHPSELAIGPYGECWAIGGSDTTSTLYAISPDRQVWTFDLSAMAVNASHLCYDPGTGCLLIGAGGDLYKWSLIDQAPVGEPLRDVYGTGNNRSSFRRGVVGRCLWLSTGDRVREIDVVDMTVVRTVDTTDWGASGVWRTGPFHEPRGHALWGLMSYGGNGVVKLVLDRVSPGGMTLDRVVGDLAARAGLADEQVDVTDLALVPVAGYVVGRRTTARACLEQLMAAYQVDAVEAGGRIRFLRRGHDPVAAIVIEDLGAAEPGAEPTAWLPLSRRQESELPQVIEILSIDPATDYQQGTQRAERHAGVATTQAEAIELPVVLTVDEAARLADATLYSAWAERTSVELSLPPKWLLLEPADVIEVLEADGNLVRLRLLSVHRGANGLIKVQAVTDDPEATVSGATGAAGDFEARTIAWSPPTTLHLIDCAMLLDAHDDAGFYLAVSGQGDPWRGATVYGSDDGLQWTSLLSVMTEATAGVATTVLPDCPGWTVWDRTGSVEVRMLHGDLANATELEVLNGANAIVLGAEVLQFTTAEEIEDGVYRLSGLLRGRRGTEWACGTHKAGERMVRLQTSTLTRIPTPSADIGRGRYFKALTFGQTTLDETDRVTFTNTARGLKPYAPVHLKGTRNAAGDLTITWVRRSRIAGEWRDGVDVPLGEASEAYEIDILNGTAVVRTISAATPTVTYPVAQQTADFGAVRPAVSVRVYQLNAIVGRGTPAEASL